jgi:WXG100 family type VII secretion target
MRVEVDAEQVARASSAAAGSVAAIRGEVAALLRHLTDLQTGWRGGAAVAFGAVLQEWTGTQRMVEESLDHITAALAAAARQYDDAEQQATRLFQR